MAVPLKEYQEDDYLRASSDSSLDLELPMFSGGLVDQGEGEGEVAGTNTTAPVVRLLSSDKRRSTWRHSRIVEEVNLINTTYTCTYMYMYLYVTYI